MTPDRSRATTISAAALLLTLLSADPTRAQIGRDRPSPQAEVFLRQQRALEDQARLALDREIGAAGKINFDAGGWLDSYIFLFDDGIESSRTQRQYNLRVWGSLSLDNGVHEGYARMRTTYTDWNHGDSYTRNEDDLDGPNLERGWYQLDFRKAFKEYGKSDLPFDLKARVGRDFTQVGTGYAVALPLDQVQLIGEWERFQTTFVLGKTPASTLNIDRSQPVADHSDRVFWIVEERYKGLQNHEPFVYWALQRDHTGERPTDYLQNYQYNSQYVGFGATGQIIDRLRYSTEWVIESGNSYGDRRFLYRDDVNAWAFDQMLEYYFKHKTQPKVSLEYMFASGDPDRLLSPSNAPGGNRFDFEDTGFLGFGYRDTGLAFGPRLSNLHAWRAGSSFRPLPDVEAAKGLELGTDWFLYWKNHADAAISDTTAGVQAGYLGWEMDYYANYRFTNDLSFTIRFGSFFPGQAFEDRTTRTFLLSGVTWSF